jgi:hypothetical protein
MTDLWKLITEAIVIKKHCAKDKLRFGAISTV